MFLGFAPPTPLLVADFGPEMVLIICTSIVLSIVENEYNTIEHYSSQNNWGRFEVSIFAKRRKGRPSLILETGAGTTENNIKIEHVEAQINSVQFLPSQHVSRYNWKYSRTSVSVRLFKFSLTYVPLSEVGKEKIPLSHIYLETCFPHLPRSMETNKF